MTQHVSQMQFCSVTGRVEQGSLASWDGRASEVSQASASKQGTGTGIFLDKKKTTVAITVIVTGTVTVITVVTTVVVGQIHSVLDMKKTTSQSTVTGLNTEIVTVTVCGHEGDHVTVSVTVTVTVVITVIVTVTVYVHEKDHVTVTVAATFTVAVTVTAVTFTVITVTATATDNWTPPRPQSKLTGCDFEMQEVSDGW